MTAIFEKLSEIRKQKKVSQKQMCEKMNINKATMSGYERGYVDIPTRRLVEYAELLGYELKLQVK